MSKPHRLFFALVPERPVRQAVTQLQHTVNAEGRAAKPENFHVTLAFLGMQPPDLIPEICAVAARLTLEPCQVVLDRTGQFRRAGVFWLGASTIPASLWTFQQSLVDALLDAGIGYDRKPWKFHLTLYRRLRKPPRIIDPVAIEWCLNGFDLIESVSVRSGVEYHSIGHWNAES